MQLSLVSLQADGRVVAHLIGTILSTDARRPPRCCPELHDGCSWY